MSLRCQRSDVELRPALQATPRGGIRLGDVAREVRLRGGHRRDPVPRAGLARLLLHVCDRLQQLLVALEVRLAGALAGLDDPLVELADLLDELLHAGVAAGRLRLGAHDAWLYPSAPHTSSTSHGAWSSTKRVA